MEAAMERRGWGWRRWLLVVVAAVALGFAPQAKAATITLSNQSSDPAVDFSELDATLDFELAGSTTLTLSASNDSTNFDIAGFYFNVSSSVAGLSLTSGPSGWKLDNSAKKGAPTDTGMFGTFDYVVWVKGKNASTDKLGAGESATFVFEIDGTGPFSVFDFANEISLTDDGEIGGYAAAKFGIDNDSPIGVAHAPEPTTGLLLGMGLCILAVSYRRRS